MARRITYNPQADFQRSLAPTVNSENKGCNILFISNSYHFCTYSVVYMVLFAVYCIYEDIEDIDLETKYPKRQWFSPSLFAQLFNSRGIPVVMSRPWGGPGLNYKMLAHTHTRTHTKPSLSPTPLYSLKYTTIFSPIHCYTLIHTTISSQVHYSTFSHRGLCVCVCVSMEYARTW